MRKKYILVVWIMIICILGITACKEDESDTKPDPEEEVVDPKEEEREEDILPTAMSPEIYLPSLNTTIYRPIMIHYSRTVPVNWTSEKTRILPYIVGFTADTTAARYKSVTNKYGSRVDKPRQETTGRFYTKKINGRWWIIDPEGYIHYERAATSLRKGSSDRNKTAWSARFKTDERWMQITREELAAIGFHGTGAFCTDTYHLIQEHNRKHPDKPMTLAPSFGFLANFRREHNYEYPGNSSENAVGLVFYGGWEQFCVNYFKSALAPYTNDPNVLGFFSDNEINFSSMNSQILSRFLEIADSNNPAREAADAFMNSKGATTVTEALNSEFAGIVATKYYKGVKDAVKATDPGMMYLGSRLHGTPKYIQGVIKAAGQYCDIVSINYYSRWSVELDTKVAEWEAWSDAPFMITEFYTKAMDTDLPNTSGAGFAVPTEKDKAYAYQHFALGLLESKSCVGWHWFKYQDDDGADNNGHPASKGIYTNQYRMYPYLGKYMKNLNYNVYELIDFFDK